MRIQSPRPAAALSGEFICRPVWPSLALPHLQRCDLGSRVGFGLWGGGLGCASSQGGCRRASRPIKPLYQACCLPGRMGFLGGCASACVCWGVRWELLLRLQNFPLTNIIYLQTRHGLGSAPPCALTLAAMKLKFTEFWRRRRRRGGWWAGRMNRELPLSPHPAPTPGTKRKLSWASRLLLLLP